MGYKKAATKSSSSHSQSLSKAVAHIEQLNHLRARDEAMFASIGEGAYVIDTDRIVTHINPRACEMLGLASEKVIGHYVYDLIPIIDEHGEVVPRDQRPLEKALLSRQSVTFSSMVHPYYLFNQKTNKRFPATITVSPIIIEGNVVGAVSVFRDSTMEYELDRAKNEFISLASHQLRTPLSIIVLNLELLERQYQAELSRDGAAVHIEEIAKASKRMVKLVNTLLNVSRIELGTLEVFSSSAHVPSVIDEKMKEFDSLLIERQLTVKKVYEGTMPSIYADTQLLQIIFDNIISNAIKYSYEESEIEITVQRKGKVIECVIKNYGYGIPDDAKPYVFSKLFRADNVRNLGEEGTGLGLYIAKSIIERLGGSISFDSKENEYTIFYLTLPIDAP